MIGARALSITGACPLYIVALIARAQGNLQQTLALHTLELGDALFQRFVAEVDAPVGGDSGSTGSSELLLLL